jgi:uncharacterized protein YkwD
MPLSGLSWRVRVHEVRPLLPAWLMLLLLSFLTACEPGNAEIQPPADDSILEATVFEEINRRRVSLRLDPLEHDDRLAEQARRHSRNMAEGTVPFGHQGFQERVAESGLEVISAAENVSRNRGHDDPAMVAVEGWLDSPGHRTNIDGDYNRTGIGVARSPEGVYFFTQLFAKTAAQP